MKFVNTDGQVLDIIKALGARSAIELENSYDNYKSHSDVMSRQTLRQISLETASAIVDATRGAARLFVSVSACGRTAEVSVVVGECFCGFYGSLSAGVLTIEEFCVNPDFGAESNCGRANMAYLYTLPTPLSSKLKSIRLPD